MCKLPLWLLSPSLLLFSVTFSSYFGFFGFLFNFLLSPFWTIFHFHYYTFISLAMLTVSFIFKNQHWYHILILEYLCTVLRNLTLFYSVCSFHFLVCSMEPPTNYCPKIFYSLLWHSILNLVLLYNLENIYITNYSPNFQYLVIH